MLDQNTDRLWYVIGAVLLGAAIVLLLNGSLPQIFGQVAGTYKELTDEVTGQEPIDYASLIDTGVTLSDGVSWKEDGEYTYNGENSVTFSSDAEHMGGIRFPAELFQMGETYTMRFDVTKLEGTIEGLGGHLRIANEADVRIDGRSAREWAYGYQQGVTEGAENKWARAVAYPDDTQTHTVEVTFTKEREETGDDNVYIQPNRVLSHQYARYGRDYMVRLDQFGLYRHPIQNESEAE